MTEPTQADRLWHDVKISSQILGFRADARAALGLSAESVVCPLCGYPVETPYRRTVTGGAIVEGCIDASHTATMLAEAPSASSGWHFRKVASTYRAEVLRGLLALETG